ncbi:MAG TPA: SGNH/GDSL hydrolase family protein [Myxococcota bacterium]|jgi:lysophospholipase L1-like esterase
MDAGRISRLLLLLAGFGLLAVACVYNELLLGLVIRPGKFGPARVAGVRSGQLLLLGAGAALLATAELARRIPPLSRVLARPSAPGLLLALLAISFPLFVAEVVLRPFAKLDPLTTLYRSDPELGWKHQPGTHTWGGSRITINAQGLRGPELPLAKPAGSFRILWLGDSVLIGDKVADDDRIFPQLVAKRLASSGSAGVETVNAGVSGYSPWQEAAYLEKEGLRYGPDLIVVVFTLNDVTEPLELSRFGGPGEGWQLGHSSASRLKHLLRQSSIFHFGRKLLGRLRFGADSRTGAREVEVLGVRSLVEAPDTPRVREAWAVALADLGRILDTGKAHGISVVLVASPFAFQLAEPALPPVPQETLARWARERGVPLFDLLPPLRAIASENGLSSDDLFIDHCHYTVTGHEWVSRLVGDWLRGVVDRDDL